MAQLPCCGLHDFLNSRAKCICEAICRNKDGFQLFFAETMGCSCSSDYSDTDWIENLDEICEHCNCPIPPQSCNQVGVHSSRSVSTWYFTDYICRECVKYFCVNLDFILKMFFFVFPCLQYIDQLIPYPSQHSPPTSPLPGNKNIYEAKIFHPNSLMLYNTYSAKYIYKIYMENCEYREVKLCKLHWRHKF